MQLEQFLDSYQGQERQSAVEFKGFSHLILRRFATRRVFIVEAEISSKRGQIGPYKWLINQLGKELLIVVMDYPSDAWLAKELRDFGFQYIRKSQEFILYPPMPFHHAVKHKKQAVNE